MPERGRSPGAKGTAFPHAQRPQKAVPSPAAGKTSPFFNAPAGGKPLPSDTASVRVSLKGKTLTLQPKDGEILPRKESTQSPKRDSLRSSHGDSLRSQKKPDNATATAKPKTGIGSAAPAAKKPARLWMDAKSGTAEKSSRPSTPFAHPSPRPQAPVRPPVDPEAPVRISKLLAERGLCSRREADAYIERGWVRVDGQPVTELGSKARPDATITLAPEAARQQDRQMTLLLHKPVGYVSGQPEPGFQPAVVLIQPQNQARGPGDLPFEPRWMKGLAPAGRLDIDSTGLLVLTQDGRIARQLIGEDSTVEKEYLVRVEGRLIANGLALLNHGLSLDGKALRPARVEWLNDDQLRFILREGRKRQIRRMCELVGLTVVGLKRVRIGQVKLGDLPLGQWRYLRPDETF